jgi:hypothetical protein
MLTSSIGWILLVSGLITALGGLIALLTPSRFLWACCEWSGTLMRKVDAFGDQPGVICHRWKFLEAMKSGSGGPGKSVRRIGFDKWHKPGRVVEHRRPNVDELIDTVRPGE